jgi:hypothetical protein
MSSPSEPAKLGMLTPEQFRQRLAGLIDPHETIHPERREEIKALAIKFASCLPSLFGESLDRKTLWDRIGTGLQAAYAKTAGADHEFFIQAVLDHIKASPTQAASCNTLAEVLTTLAAWDAADRQAWITSYGTLLIPILVYAREGWSATKTRKDTHV